MRIFALGEKVVCTAQWGSQGCSDAMGYGAASLVLLWQELSQAPIPAWKREFPLSGCWGGFGLSGTSWVQCI